jgi:toxin ParE1/3/4
MRARLGPRARQDLIEAIRWIAKDNPQAARNLRNAVRRVAVQLGDQPRSGVTRVEIASTRFRFAMISGFPYIAVYNCERSPPLIVRILHGARDLPEVLRDLA